MQLRLAEVQNFKSIYDTTNTPDMKWIKVSEVKEGDMIELRGGKKTYIAMAFCGGDRFNKGLLFIKDTLGKEIHRRMFPFTLLKRINDDTTNTPDNEQRLS
jgi:hypothetical protein